MSQSRLARSDSDAVLPVSIGTVVWIVVLIAMILFRSTLDESGRGWWLGVAAVGVVTGLGGVVFLRWRRGRRR
jgi:hypothetical protein